MQRRTNDMQNINISNYDFTQRQSEDQASMTKPKEFEREKLVQYGKQLNDVALEIQEWI